MSRLSLALSLSVVGLATIGTTQALTQNAVNSRRAFVAKVGSAATMGWLLNVEMPHNGGCQCSQCNSNAHSDDCQCSQCNSNTHSDDCQCGSCAGTAGAFFRPQAAMAYERDVGGEGRSADSAAYNIQARETNARLERDGFKLDTKEEETARLSGALSSFSYDASTPKQSTGRGYGKNKNAGTPEKK